MTKVNEGTAALTGQQLAEVRSAIRKARQKASFVAIARASGLSSRFVSLVAQGKMRCTQSSAKMLLEGAATFTEPARKPVRLLSGEPLDALVGDVRRALAERFGGDVEVLARAVNAPVDLVKRLLDGATEIAASDARKFAAFRVAAPARATAFASSPLEQARSMLPARLREPMGAMALVHVRAVLSRVEQPKAVEPSALALVRKWGPEAIAHVLDQANRGLASQGGA